MKTQTDFTNFEANPERVEEIRVDFTSGEVSAQGGFSKLVRYILDELEAHRDGANQAPRGFLAALKNKLTVAGFADKGSISKSYFGPSFSIANKLHSGKASNVLKAIVEDFFLDTGEGREGSIVRGSLFTPARINAGWGGLMTNDGPFSVDTEGVIATDQNGKELPWHALSIKDIKAFHKTGSPDPKVAQSLMRVLGNPADDYKNEGSLMKVVKDLRKDNETFNSDVIRGLCEQIEGSVEEMRGDMSVTLADCVVEDAQRAKIAAEQKRLERAKERSGAPILGQKVKGGEVVAPPEKAKAK